MFVSILLIVSVPLVSLWATLDQFGRPRDSSIGYGRAFHALLCRRTWRHGPDLKMCVTEVTIRGHRRVTFAGRGPKAGGFGRPEWSRVAHRDSSRPTKGPPAQDPDQHGHEVPLVDHALLTTRESRLNKDKAFRNGELQTLFHCELSRSQPWLSLFQAAEPWRLKGIQYFCQIYMDLANKIQIEVTGMVRTSRGRAEECAETSPGLRTPRQCIRV